MLIKLNQIVMYYNGDEEEIPRKVNREAWFNIDSLVSIGPAYQKGYEGTTMIEFVRGNTYVGVIFVEESVEDILKTICELEPHIITMED